MLNVSGNSSWVLSASQIETFRTCQRKWAWDKIGGIKPGGTEATRLGGLVHAVLETYLEHGTLPDQSTREGHIATAGIHLLPTPMSDGLSIETKFKFTSPRGNSYTGRKDFVVHPPGVDVPIVGDHKTTSHFRWAKTPEELRDNVQAVIYAADAATDSVDLVWIYYRTKGPPQARKVHLRVVNSEVEPRLSSIDDTADEIHSVLASVGKDDIKSLPPTLDSCFLYGQPCTYLHLCNHQPRERLGSIFASIGDTMSSNLPLPPSTNTLLERLRAQQSSHESSPKLSERLAPPAPSPPVIRSFPQPPKYTQVGTWRDVDGEGVYYCYCTKQISIKEADGECHYCGEKVNLAPLTKGEPGPKPEGGIWYDKSSVNMYSCHCGTQSTFSEITSNAGNCQRCLEKADNFPSFLLGVSVNPPERGLEVVVPSPAPATMPTQSPAIETRVKRHRRTKEEMEAYRSKTPPQVADTLTAPVPTPLHATLHATLPAPVPSPITSELGIGTLLIDCLPIGAQCNSVEKNIFAPARALVKEAHGVDDYRMLEYGKGSGIFASAVMHILSENYWETIAMDSNNTDAMHVMSILVSNSNNVFRGTK